jgi:uncharacterized protein (DUF2236 family)
MSTVHDVEPTPAGSAVLRPVARTVRRIIAGSVDGVTATNKAIARPVGAPGWFGPTSAAWQVHGSVSTFLGGIRALLLQSLHPLALAGVDGHSSYRHDPFGRLHRTGAFIAATTFGSTELAQRTVDAVSRIHQSVSGTAADGRPYSATDPVLLRWVHLALVDSMLDAYRRFGTNGVVDADAYVDDMAVVGSAMGVTHPPRSVRELAEAFEAFMPDLTGSDHVHQVRSFVMAPPLSWPSSLGYGVLARAAEDSLPGWTRDMLGSPVRRDSVLYADRVAAQALLRTLQAALVESPARAAARERLGVPFSEMEKLRRQRWLMPT